MSMTDKAADGTPICMREEQIPAFTLLSLERRVPGNDCSVRYLGVRESTRSNQPVQCHLNQVEMFVFLAVCECG